MKIAIISGVPESLRGFRGQLITRLCQLGHDVTALAAEENSEVTRFLNDRGARFVAYPMQRQQTNPFHDLRTCLFLYRWLRREKPDLVLAYTAKPVVWGGIAARLAGSGNFNALITGLGNQFVTDSVGQRATAALLKPLYRLALRRARAVIFQNGDDRRELAALARLTPGQTHQVNGSGVNLDFFQPSDIPGGTPVFLTVARLIGAKGLREYAAAAAEVKRSHPDVRFQLVGPFENGSDALSEQEVQQWHDAGTIDYLGAVDDARTVIAGCHVYVLPSFYGEGLPRTILEAMAVGRPVLTTDNVGCRDAVVPGRNGLLVEPRSVQALVEGADWFLAHRDQWAAMGHQGRVMAEELYDVRLVNEELLKILNVSATSATAGDDAADPAGHSVS